jgi:hypothetical protein
MRTPLFPLTATNKRMYRVALSILQDLKRLGREFDQVVSMGKQVLITTPDYIFNAATESLRKRQERKYSLETT